MERIVTNDYYLTAYLLSEGCILDHVEKNVRRRISFIVTGCNVRWLRERYRSGKVPCDIRSFRVHLQNVRRQMDKTQRSEPCPQSPKLSLNL